MSKILLELVIWIFIFIIISCLLVQIFSIFKIRKKRLAKKNNQQLFQRNNLVICYHLNRWHLGKIDQVYKYISFDDQFGFMYMVVVTGDGGYALVQQEEIMHITDKIFCQYKHGGELLEAKT